MSSRGSHVLQIAEYTAGQQAVEDLRVKGALSLVGQMMDGEARNDGVKPAQFGQAYVEVVLDDGDSRVGGKITAQAGDHHRGKIERHRLGIGVLELDQAEQAPVAAPQIEKPRDTCRQAIEQSGFAFPAVGNRIRLFQIIQSVPGLSPKVDIFRHCARHLSRG